MAVSIQHTMFVNLQDDSYSYDNSLEDVDATLNNLDDTACTDGLVWAVFSWMHLALVISSTTPRS